MVPLSILDLTPMTYMLGGRQYIVLAIGGRGVAAEFIAYRLPSGAPAPRRRGAED
jgi:glucose dehydrogenase